MPIDLKTLKTLRDRGATVQMQEDLASFLDDGYDSDLFLPTIDFILKLQSQAQGQSVEQENSVDLSDFDIPKVYDASYFEKISIKASGELIKSAALEEQLKLEILAYLDSMEIQRNVGQEHQESPQSRAHISQSKRKDRRTGNVKSMFESLASVLSALQVRFSQQNTKNSKSQAQVQQQMRIRDIIRLKLMQDAAHKHGDDHHGEQKGGKSSRSFLSSMRKALGVKKNKNNNNNDSNSSDAQQARASTKEAEKHQEAGKAVNDVAHKYDQAAKQASKSAGENKSEEKKDVQITASKAIGDVKEAQAAKQETGDDKTTEKTKTESKIRNTNLQSRLQRTRLRLQQQRLEATKHEHEHSHGQSHASHGKIDDQAAAKAVSQLKNMGVSLSEGEMTKLNNKELSQVAKLQDKQRGG